MTGWIVQSDGDRIAYESFIKGLRADIKETVWEK